MIMDLPQWYQYALVIGLGLIIGSFLNVLIYRFNTGKSLNGRSHCLSCGKLLGPLELLPVVSYLCLRGRCRGCSSHIPLRYVVVELSTALLFLISFLTATTLPDLLLLWGVCAIMVVIVVYDIRHLIIPDSLTLALTVLTLAWYGWRLSEGATFEALVLSCVAALSATGFFFLLWFISKGRWIGFGDVKLAFPLALLAGPGLVFSMVVYSFWAGALISLAMIGVGKIRRGQLHLQKRGSNLTMKSVVPFAPFMILGCLIVIFTHYNVLSLFTFL